MRFIERTRQPYGANCLAFDGVGDLYVLNAGNSTIVRFPNAQPPGTVFADHSDGITDRGALEFSPSGDLFYTGDLANQVIRIDPIGQATVFDTRGFVALAFDDRENLFPAIGARVYRYDGPGPNPATRRILADGFSDFDNQVSIALSPEHRSLYFAEAGSGRLYTIDPDNGVSSLIADFSDLSSFGIYPTGATVYAPDPNFVPGRCCFGAGTLSPGCVDGVIRAQCGDDEPAPVVFTPKEACPPTGPDCEPVTGACCDSDPFGTCTDDALISECSCASCAWFESQACAEIECTPEPIPSVSEWGLATLTLSLMIGAKVVFGTGVPAPAA